MIRVGLCFIVLITTIIVVTMVGMMIDDIGKEQFKPLYSIDYFIALLLFLGIDIYSLYLLVEGLY